MDRRLLPLALAMFAVGTDGFVIAGLLPSISEDLEVSVSAAGQLVTVFALTFAVTAPLLGAATGSLPRRAALLGALCVFVAGNAVTALGTSYEVVLAARVVAAAGAGLIGSTAFSAAAAIAPPERRGRALAFVMGGLAAAAALGLPIGTLIGAADWRLTLWAVAALGLLAGVGVALWMPKISLPAASLAGRLEPMKDSWVLGVLAVTVAALAGMHLLYTYIATALEPATGGSQRLLTIVLLAWGVGIVVGNTLVGRLTDRYPPERVLLFGLVCLAGILAVGPAVVSFGMTSSVVWAAAWGVCMSLPVIPQQHRLAIRAPKATPVLLGLNSSAIYMGVAVGGALGGILQTWIPATQLGLPAAGVAAISFVIALSTTPPQTQSKGEAIMTETKKVDPRKEMAHLYNPSPKEIVEVDVPEMRFLMADGEGDPNTSVAYKEAVEALFALSYTLKFAVKREENIDYRVMPLEGLWWMDEEVSGLDDIFENRDAWKWTTMISQPEWVTNERVESAFASVAKKKDPPGLPRVRFESFHEGRAAQIMHIGPFSEERPTVESVDLFLAGRGSTMRGKHHEIYLSDFNRTAPERMKTIIRHPFR